MIFFTPGIFDLFTIGGLMCPVPGLMLVLVEGAGSAPPVTFECDGGVNGFWCMLVCGFRVAALACVAPSFLPKIFPKIFLSIFDEF